MASPPPDRLRWHGRFADPATEAAYGTAQLTGHRRLGQLVVVCLMGLDLTFIPIDLLNFGLCWEGGAAVGVRLLTLSWSAGWLVLLGKARTALGVERGVGLWAAGIAAANILELAALPGNHLGAAAAFAVGVVLVYLLPLRLEWCAAVGLTVTAAFLAVLLVTRRPEAPDHLLVDTAVGLVMANGVGAAVGRRLQADRRRQFAAAAALERAAAEIRTLQGLLPICACCKNIRDGAGGWHRLEAYIQMHTAATFTHGICPRCLESEYGLTPDGSKTETATPR